MGTSSNGWVKTTLAGLNVLSPKIGKMVNSVALTYGNMVGLCNALVDPNFLSVLTNFFGDPNDFLMEMLVYPFYIPTSGDETVVTIGNLSQPSNSTTSTYVMGYVVDDTLMSESMRVVFDEYISPRDPSKVWYYDYSGYTEVRVYLPYYGFITVPMNEVINRYLKVGVVFDFIGGECCYYICTAENAGDDSSLWRILSKVKTSVAVKIPINRTNLLDLRRNLIQTGVNVGLSFAGAYALNAAGAGAAVSTLESVQTTTYDVQGRGSYKGARMKQMKSGNVTTTQTQTRTSSAPNHMIGAFHDLVDASMGALSNSIAHAQTEISKDAGFDVWGCQCVKVLIYRPKLPYMGDYGRYYGRPLGAVRTLTNLTGFTKMADVHLEGLAGCTTAELNELNSLLCNGVIIAAH